MLPALIVALLVTADDAEPEFKPSLEIESPEEAWIESGLRVGLGYAFDRVIGDGVSPGGVHHSALLRLGARLDENWSLLGTFRYGVRFGPTGGLRFGGTIEPTWHVTDELSLAVGAGIGGFIIPATGAPTPTPQIVATYTVPSSGPLIGACQGAGLLALARAEYTFFVSQLFATGPSLQLDAQWTSCTQRLGRSDPDTAEAIDLQQYWTSYGVSLAWIVWWR